MKKEALSQNEVLTVLDWVKESPNVSPTSIILSTIEKMSHACLSIQQNPGQDIFKKRFLESLGILPKSEKGNQLSNQ